MLNNIDCVTLLHFKASTLIQNMAKPTAPKSQRSLRTTVVAGLLSLLAACGGSEDAKNDPVTPPVVVTQAAAKVWDLSRAMGPGINFGNMLESPNEGEWGLSAKPEYIQAAWNAGFRTVRLPVRWSNHASAQFPYTIDQAFLARVTSLVDQLLARGFHVVLNMHHYRQLDDDLPDVGEFLVDPAILEDRFVAIWSQIGHHLGSRSDRLLFELYNEPHGRLTPAKWNSLADTTLKQVRISNKERVVIIGPTNFNSPYALSTLTMPLDPYLMATVHFYEPFNFTHQGATWVTPVLPTGVTCCSPEQASAIFNGIHHAKYWSDATGYPVLLGEFGAYSAADMASRVNYTRLVRQTAAQANMPWVYWEFGSLFGVYDPVTNAFRPELLNALVGN